MSIVVFNVLTVPAEMRETLEQRFASRAGAVESSDGFEWFELLRPVEGTDRYLVYTRWRSQEDFQKWQSSQDFSRGHRGAAAPAGGSQGAPATEDRTAATGDANEGQPARPPAASGSEIWTFDVVTNAGPS